MENLSDFYIQKAKVELREDKIRKEQSIKQFYDWLKKHPFIRKCDVKSNNILQYLRARKYNMDKVYESFNKNVIFTKTHPQLADLSNFQKFLEFYDKGPILVMKERDEEGRKIIIVRHKILEDLDTDYNNVIKLMILASSGVAAEPETQISGVIFIHDLKNISMKYVLKTDLELIAETSQLFKFLPFRIKQINIVGLPAIANAAFEIFTSFLSEKLKNRITFLKNSEDLKKIFDEKILPMEYGGTITNEEDHLKDFKNKFKKIGLETIEILKGLEVDEEKMRKYANEEYNEGIGSFRKLEID